MLSRVTGKLELGERPNVMMIGEKAVALGREVNHKFIVVFCFGRTCLRGRKGKRRDDDDDDDDDCYYLPADEARRKEPIRSTNVEIRSLVSFQGSMHDQNQTVLDARVKKKEKREERGEGEINKGEEG